MFKFKSGLSTKLTIAFGSFGLICTLTAIGGYNAIRSMRSIHAIANQFNHVRIDLSTAIQLQRSFVSEERSNARFHQTGASDLSLRFHMAIDSLQQQLEKLQEQPRLADFGLTQRVLGVGHSAEAYRDLFGQLQQLYLERGFKDDGAEGVLRQAIHEVEAAAFPYDLSDLLMLRRHEKDFFLRHDLKYQEKFHTDLSKFQSRIDAISQERPEFKAAQEEIMAKLNQYRMQFDRIVELEMAIGFGNSGGIMRELGTIETRVNKELTSLQAVVDRELAIAETSTIRLFLLATLVLLVVGVLLTLRFTRWLSRPIRAIKDRITEMSNGQLPEPFEKMNTDELGEAKKAFNNLVERIKAATGFAREVGGGNLDTEYPKIFANDVLSLALQEMQLQLQNNAQEEQERQWMAEGLNHLSDLLRKHQQDFDVLAKELVANISRTLKASQVALYLVKTEEGEAFLHRSATYAFDRQKYASDRVSKGEGLTGTCWLEGEAIYMTEVPNDFLRIRSGLGDAAPTSVYILPLKANEKVLGVLELAAFHAFTTVEKSLLDRMATSIAASLAFVQTNEQTVQLLREQNELTSELRAQEEELRQNQEEMISTQEELNRQLETSQSHLSEKDQQIHFLKNQLQSKGMTLRGSDPISMN
ncbi:MAG: GAF domain-containing protein [Salibacteraceae bacterium]